MSYLKSFKIANKSPKCHMRKCPHDSPKSDMSCWKNLKMTAQSTDCWVVLHLMVTLKRNLKIKFTLKDLFSRYLRWQVSLPVFCGFSNLLRS